MDLKTLQNLYKTHKESRLSGRYISDLHIAPLIDAHRSKFQINTIGSSVLGRAIHGITIGTGPKKILMWSQMHGNESTTTKAIFDLCNTFANPKSDILRAVLDNCTLMIVPMLNPDGAAAYTRLNANGVDLNRDAQARTQPESRTLRTLFESFGPQVCFNLHGQRTIFSAGNFNRPATVSFLSPAQDAACTLTNTRKKAMEIIVGMNAFLQQQIPNQVGLYDDAFNPNCVGDTFQSLNVPTVLFEAGHFANDYDRELVRESIYQSLMIAITSIAFSDIQGHRYDGYFEIPMNQKRFYDVVIRNATVDQQITDVAIQYREVLQNGRVAFVPVVENISDLSDFFAHKEVDANRRQVLTDEKRHVYVGYENDFVWMDTEKFVLKP